MVVALARAIEPRYRGLVLLAGFGGLRLGELLALKAKDFDPERGVVRVEKQAIELRDSTRVVTAPKTEAGRRVVHLPTAVSDALVWHLDSFPPKDADSALFSGPLSDGLRRATLQKAWGRARRATGLAEVHLHDLRHAAGTLAAQTDATTREVMARLGHASPAAAQRYQHAAERRDAVIASALDIMLDALPRITGDLSTAVQESAALSLDDTPLVPRGWVRTSRVWGSPHTS
jgi:integrase